MCKLSKPNKKLWVPLKFEGEGGNALLVSLLAMPLLGTKTFYMQGKKAHTIPVFLKKNKNLVGD